MTEKSKAHNRQPALFIDSEVVRQIRQHARSSSKTEICGVLIGQDRDGCVRVQASITGQNADEAGAHVTFTQDTWAHIYKIKDRDFPEERIVGWYHSHPGFGVFLSEHDTFIHKNFFASPGQVAWVFDPHSDEEGCFGWVGGRIERLTQIAVVDGRGGERADQSGRPEPTYSAVNREDALEYPGTNSGAEDDTAEDSSLQRLVSTFFSHLTVLLLGILLAWYVLPAKVVVMPVPVDPRTGEPMSDSAAQPNRSNDGTGQNAQEGKRNEHNSSGSAGSEKGDRDQPK